MSLFAGSDIVSLIGQVLTLGGVLIVGRWAYKGKKDSAATLVQVANDHDTNLRDDLTQVIDTQKEHGEKLTEHSTQLATLGRGRQENRADIDWLIDENTEQRRRRDIEQWRAPAPGGRRDRRENNGYQPPHPA